MRQQTTYKITHFAGNPNNLFASHAQHLVRSYGLATTTRFRCDNTRSVSNEPVLFAFDLNTGAAKWTYQQAVDQLTLIAASDGGGVVAKSTLNGVDTILRFDPSGNVTPDSWTASNINNFGGWFWEGLSSSSASGVYAQPINLSASPLNQQQTRIAKQDLTVSTFSQAGQNQTVIMGVVL